MVETDGRDSDAKENDQEEGKERRGGQAVRGKAAEAFRLKLSFALLSLGIRSCMNSFFTLHCPVQSPVLLFQTLPALWLAAPLLEIKISHTAEAVLAVQWKSVHAVERRWCGLASASAPASAVYLSH